MRSSDIWYLRNSKNIKIIQKSSTIRKISYHKPTTTNPDCDK